jgi:hypothetical protein
MLKLVNTNPYIVLSQSDHHLIFCAPYSFFPVSSKNFIQSQFSTSEVQLQFTHLNNKEEKNYDPNRANHSVANKCPLLFLFQPSLSPSRSNSYANSKLQYVTLHTQFVQIIHNINQLCLDNCLYAYYGPYVVD